MLSATDINSAPDIGLQERVKVDIAGKLQKAILPRESEGSSAVENLLLLRDISIHDRSPTLNTKVAHTSRVFGMNVV